MKKLFLLIREIWQNRKNHFMIEKTYLQLPKDSEGAPLMMHKWFYNALTREWVREWKQATFVGVTTGYVAVLILRKKMKKQNQRMADDFLKIDYNLVSASDLLFLNDVFPTSFSKEQVDDVKNWHKDNNNG